MSLSLVWCSSSSSGPSTAGHPVGNGATVTQATGASGGTVSLQGTGTTLSIPAGALASSQTISITSTMDAPPAGVTNVSPIYQFGPAGLTFSVPVTVSLAFTGQVANPVIVWSSSDGTSFETIATTVSGMTASGQVTHFSEGFVAQGSTTGSLTTAPPLDAGGTGQAADGGSGTTTAPDASTTVTTGGQDASIAQDATTVTTSGDGAASEDSGHVSTNDAASGSCAVCNGGFCASACPSPLTTCSGEPGQCIDLTTDSINCGGCGTQCTAGTACSQGVCSPSCGGSSTASGCASAPSEDGSVNCSSCAAGGGTWAACSNGCTEVSTDPNNCGTCGTVCSSGQSCVNGGCTPLCTGGGYCANGFCATSCPSGQTACGGGSSDVTGSCADLQTDSNHCGACGTSCGGSEICASGVCVSSCGLSSGASGCAAPPSADGGAVDCSSCAAGGGTWAACTNGCTEVSTDPNNCGTCGTVCTAGQVCTSGSCAPICPNSDVCANGACVASCPAGTTQCGSVSSGATATCTSTSSDSNNCGACGVACPVGQSCNAGTCVTTCGEADAAASAVGL